MHNLPPLNSALIIPCLGLSLLFCFAAHPPVGTLALLCVDTDEGRQPKPAEDNKTRLILLRCQYDNYQRCRRHLRQAQTEREAIQWRKNTRAAISLYNQVADDTDSSAFDLTPLPRHLRPAWPE